MTQRFWLGMCVVVMVLGVIFFSHSATVGYPDSHPLASTAFVQNAAPISLAAFRIATGRYPTSKEGLHALLVPPPGLKEKWHGPYIDRLPKDSWGHDYQYQCPGLHNPQSYDLWSLGPDGTVSADDIVNWSNKDVLSVEK